MSKRSAKVTPGDPARSHRSFEASHVPAFASAVPSLVSSHLLCSGGGQPQEGQ